MRAFKMRARESARGRTEQRDESYLYTLASCSLLHYLQSWAASSRLIGCAWLFFLVIDRCSNCASSARVAAIDARDAFIPSSTFLQSSCSFSLFHFFFLHRAMENTMARPSTTGSHQGRGTALVLREDVSGLLLLDELARAATTSRGEATLPAALL